MTFITMFTLLTIYQERTILVEENISEFLLNMLNIYAITEI